MQFYTELLQQHTLCVLSILRIRTVIFAQFFMVCLRVSAHFYYVCTCTGCLLGANAALKLFTVPQGHIYVALSQFTS